MTQKQCSFYSIKVIPRAKKTEYIGKMSDDTIKIRVKAIPENGKANEELIRYFYEYLGCKKDTIIEVISGQSSTRKVVRVTLPL